jgi:hypothetical protein
MGVGRQDSHEAAPLKRETPLKRQVGRLNIPTIKAYRGRKAGT